MYHSFLIHSSADGHLPCRIGFYVLTLPIIVRPWKSLFPLNLSECSPLRNDRVPNSNAFRVQAGYIAVMRGKEMVGFMGD